MRKKTRKAKRKSKCFFMFQTTRRREITSREPQEPRGLPDVEEEELPKRQMEWKLKNMFAKDWSVLGMPLRFQFRHRIERSGGFWVFDLFQVGDRISERNRMSEEGLLR